MGCMNNFKNVRKYVYDKYVSKSYSSRKIYIYIRVLVIVFVYNNNNNKFILYQR